MDIDTSNAPAEYHELKWLFLSLHVGYGVSYVISYIALIDKSFRDRSYGLSMMALCCNFTWEAVYTFIYISSDPVTLSVQIAWISLNAVIVGAAVKFSKNEWNHAPLVQQHIFWIWGGCLSAFFLMHLAAAEHLGRVAGFLWSGCFCQLLVSAGALCQLISRGSTRGSSYFIWFTRFLGASGAWAVSVLYVCYWPEAWSWISNPLSQWLAVTCSVLDVLYGVCFWHIRQLERKTKKSD